MAYFNQDDFSLSYGKLQHPEGVEFIQSPNFSRMVDLRYLIMHYTAAPSLQSSINWFKQERAKASSQFLIDYDGKIVQMVNTGKAAWHAGRSSYDGFKGLNKYSIGIEIVNPGHMEILGGGRYRTWYGEIFTNESNVTARSGETFSVEIVEKKIAGHGTFGFLMATPEQVETSVSLGSFLMDKFSLKECLPHSVISPGRKLDTGPILSDSVFARIESRGDSGYREDDGDDGEVGIVNVRSRLNMRDAPHGDVIERLRNGTRLRVLSENEGWLEVYTSVNSVRGYVSANYVTRYK